MLTIVLGTKLRAAAQGQGGVNLTAQAGLDGFCKDNAWIPVRVTVENTAQEIKGRVQVSTQPSNGQTVVGADILLPNTSHKELFLYVYPQTYVRNLIVSLVVDGKTVAKQDLAVSCLQSEDMLFGILSDKPSSYDILNDVKPLRGVAKVVQLRPEDLPDRSQGWMMLDTLVIGDTDTGKLTNEQHQSLADWLANGGKLMITGGPQWPSTTAGLQEFLPVDLVSTQSVPDLAELQTYFQLSNPIEGNTVLAVGKPKPGANVLIEQESIPILVEKQIGFGKVIYLAVDPALQPLSGNDGMLDIYDYLLSDKSVRPGWMNSWDTDSANRAVSTLRELGLPSSIYICGWLLLYVVAIGPINFIVLRRIKRRELAWLTIPGLVLVFSLIAYFYGSFYRGGRPILNRMAVVQAWDGSDKTNVHALVGLYSPGRSKYTLEADNGFMLSPFTNDGNWQISQEGAKTVMSDVPVEIGGMKVVSVEGSYPTLPLKQDLVISLSDQDPTLKGTVTNAGTIPLRDAIIVTSGGWKRLGNFPSGSSHDVELSLTPNEAGPEFYSLTSEDILDLGYPAPQENEDSTRRAAWLQALLNQSYYMNDGNWGTYLIGWLDNPVIPVSVRGQPFETMDTTLYIARLTPSIRYKSTTLKLTPGLFAWESSYEGASPYFSSDVPAGGYTLRFQPAISIPFHSVQQLNLNMNNGSNSNITPDKVSASLWDFRASQWVKIEALQWGWNPITEPTHYMGPGGEIRLKIDPPTNDYVEISPSDFTVLVNP